MCYNTFMELIKRPFVKLWKKNKEFRKRRPHRTLRLSRKRDIDRSLKLPGYIAFSTSVWKIIWRNKSFYLKFFVMFTIFCVVLLGVLNQTMYTSFRDSLTDSEVGEEMGILKYFSLAVSAITSQGGNTMSEGQIAVGIMAFLLSWLMLVWAMRQIFTGKIPKLRDAMYNSGYAVISTLIVLIIGVLQCLPFAITFLIYSSFVGVGILNYDIAIENMVMWLVIALVGVLTLYWLTSTFIALLVVTLPGMYPGKALKAAGDLVVGRRLRILYRILYMIWPLLLLWILFLIPIILLDNAIRIEWLPIVPASVLLLTALSLIWIATYIYMLYRKIVDDDVKPVK